MMNEAKIKLILMIVTGAIAASTVQIVFPLTPLMPEQYTNENPFIIKKIQATDFVKSDMKGYTFPIFNPVNATLLCYRKGKEIGDRIDVTAPVTVLAKTEKVVKIVAKKHRPRLTHRKKRIKRRHGL